MQMHCAPNIPHTHEKLQSTQSEVKYTTRDRTVRASSTCTTARHFAQKFRKPYRTHYCRFFDMNMSPFTRSVRDDTSISQQEIGQGRLQKDPEGIIEYQRLLPLLRLFTSALSSWMTLPYRRMLSSLYDNGTWRNGRQNQAGFQGSDD